MAAYMQMGHDTQNLVGERGLNKFDGIILSPINREPPQLREDVDMFRTKGNYDIIMDPQLYFPTKLRGCLPNYKYYPSDIDTADFSSDSWWDDVLSSLAEYVYELKIDGIASPVKFPKLWNDDYFASCTETAHKLVELLKSSHLDVFTTCLVNISYLVDDEAVLRTSSILSSQESSGYYIVFYSEVSPRQELSDPKELLGMMHLIWELRTSNRPTIISNCSSEMPLFKAVGATHCATGKFFNLRRFTKSRYDESPGGGGQLSYWFEPSLMAFLREPDVLRLIEEEYGNLITAQTADNCWAKEILENLQTGQPKAWLGKGWRQYLCWFSNAENELSNSNIKLVDERLKTAESNWIKIEDAGIFMDEPRNNGTWLRPWRQSLSKFRKEHAVS